MYIVKLDNKKIYDQRVDELTLIDPEVELEENSAGSFTFTMTYNHPYYDEIKRRKSVIQVFEDDDLLFSGMVYEVTEDFYKNKKVYCEGELSYLNDSVQRPAEYHNFTVSALLETYINNHNAQVEPEKQFQLGIVTVHDSNDSIFCYTNMETTLECIKNDLVDDLGGIMRIRHSEGVKYIDYITENEVRTNPQVIRLGENLINYKSNISSLDIATAIIPLGATLEESPIPALDMRLDIKSVNNGLDYVSDSVAVNTFGWIYKTIEWDDVTTPEVLKQKGEKYLSSTQFDNLVIEVNALDLHLIDTYEKAFRLSDQIRIVSKPHGLKDKYFRLTKQKISLNNPESNTITLGKEEHLSLSARTAQANAAAVKAMESITPTQVILNRAQNNASQLISNSLGGYVVMQDTDGDGHPDEILVMDTADKNTATKVWRWNQNGLGYSNTGYNGNYGLAMTIDGAIVADYITTGSLVGLEINNGNKTFHVDENGKMIAANAEIKGKIEANSGEVSGFIIGDYELTNSAELKYVYDSTHFIRIAGGSWGGGITIGSGSGNNTSVDGGSVTANVFNGTLNGGVRGGANGTISWVDSSRRKAYGLGFTNGVCTYVNESDY